ncbi:MAG: HAMP domain-containing histidine kinase [Lachnospiraceae bacterium]|nr:HAMP domain-containing histidine kinase [Lachnospiraceae bacterium]
MDILLSKIRHEMGNAMTIVRCSLNVLKSECPQVSETKYFDNVISELGYMENLLADMSFFNKRDEVNKEFIDIEKLITGVIESSLGTEWVRDTKITMEKENQDEIYMVKCDLLKVRQMLINLIKNGAEAIGGTDKEGKIHIMLARKDNDILISVTDNGCGIEPADLNNIFEPFVTHKKDGTGIGLAIVKEVVDIHNGKIKVVSELGTGTTFEISLPINLVAGKTECLV